MAGMDWMRGGGQVALGSDTQQQGNNVPGTGMADLVTKSDQFNKILAQLVLALQNLSPSVTDRFTMDAAASKTITNAAIATSSYVQIWPNNAAAATLMGSAKSLYWTTADGSFTVSTANAAAATGGEAFNWAAWNTL